MSLRRALGLIAVLSLVAAPSARAQLPVGEADGVRIFRVQGALVVKFTPRAEKLRRRVAGRLVSVMCTELPSSDDFGFVSINTGGATYRMPKRGRTLRTGDLTRRLDYCRLSLVRRARRGRKLILSVPLTQRGAVYLDEEDKAATLFSVLLFAALAAEEKGSGSYPTYAELLDFASSQPGSTSAEEIARKLVALAGPDGTPEAGAVGYYSDGGEHVAAVMLSRSGRRLFIEYEPGDVLRTNVAGFIYGDRDG